METLMELLEKVNGIVQDFIEILGPEVFFVAAVFMLLHCFFGYQLLRVWSTIFGMVIGGAVGLLFGINMEYEVQQVIMSVLIAALAMGWVFYQIYLVGIFGIFAAAGMVALHFLNPDASTTFVVVMSCLSGLLGVLCVRPIMIVFSAALGGGLGSYFLLHAQGVYDFDTLVQRTIIFAACGVLCQFILTTPFRVKKDEDEEESSEEKKTAHRPLMERIFVKPIEQLQPEEIDHKEGLPSSEDLDKMIAEQMTGMSDDVNDFAGDIDLAIFKKLSVTAFEENVKDDEAAEEDSPQEILDENGLPDIPDTVLDEMIMEALPEAEEYLPAREPLVCEEVFPETADIETVVLDENAVNDFATFDDEPAEESAVAIEEMAERLEKGELRTAEEIEERIAALEEVIEKDAEEAKDSIFSNPFRAEKSDDIDLPVFNAGMSLAEAAAALQIFKTEENIADAEEAVAEDNADEQIYAGAEKTSAEADMKETEFFQTDILFEAEIPVEESLIDKKPAAVYFTEAGQEEVSTEENAEENE